MIDRAHEAETDFLPQPPLTAGRSDRRAGRREVASSRERRSAAAVYDELYARYSSLIENAQEGIFQSTPDGRLLFVNRVAARSSG